MSREPRLCKFEFNAEKFKKLVLYIAERCADDPTYGTIKLHTALYYADFAAYRMFGQPISGAVYEKYQAGPVARQLPAIRKELIESGAATFVNRPHFLGGHRQFVPVNLSQSMREHFDERERELIDSIVDFFRGKSEREVSQFVRSEPGWAAADEQEAIPYESGWLKPTPLDPDSEAAAFRYAREHGYR